MSTALSFTLPNLGKCMSLQPTASLLQEKILSLVQGNKEVPGKKKLLESNHEIEVVVVDVTAHPN